MSNIDAWCLSQGIVSQSDLAYFFESYEEALAEAGEAVAQAWLSARTETQRGHAGLLLDLYARQRPEATPEVPKAAPKAMPKPSRAPAVAARPALPREAGMPRKRGLPAATPLIERNAKFKEVFVAAMKLGSRYSELFSTTPRVDVSMVPRLVDQVLGAHEEETLSRVAKTWQELAVWADAHNLIVGKMSAVEVAAFVENSSAPARILSAMQFLVKRLYFNLDLTLAMDLRKTKQSVIGLGQRQAPVVQPILLAKLEESISYSIIGSDAKWLGLYATWCVATGCVRWAHVQRSRLLHMTETSMVFECLRGKQRQRRCGFFWSCPRYSIFEHTDFGYAFLQCVEDLPKDHACIAFELETLAEIPHRVAKSQVAQCLVHEVGSDDLRRITSKSWRQFSVTWAFLSKIDSTQVLALGNWIEATEKGASTTAWRYHRGKLQQSQELKLLMARCIKCLVLHHDGHSWHQITQDLALRVRQEQERVILAVDRVVAELHHRDSRMSEQVVQLQNSAFLKKIRRKRVSRGEKAESDSAAMAPVPVKAMPTSIFLPLGCAESKEPEPVRASSSSMGSRDKPPEPAAAPVAVAISPPPVPAPPARGPEVIADETAEGLYDRLSRDPGNPRARPTPIFFPKAPSRIPALILGPLPTRELWPFFQEYKVKSVITCFEQPLYSKGGAVPQDTLVTQFPITNFSWMEQELKSTWNEIVKMLNVTFEADESIYVHCMAGRHRAPLPAGALLGLLTGENFDSALASIRRCSETAAMPR